MTYNLNARPGMAAIAAVLALSSTPSFAQEAPPVAEPTPVDTTTTTTTTTSETPSTASDPLAPVEAEPVAATTTTKTTKSVARTTRTVARNSSRSTAGAATAAPDPASTAPESTPIAVPAAPAVAPMPSEELAANPMTPDVAAPADSSMMVDMDDALPIAGAAGLALLGLAGAGMAMRRRRRTASDENLSYSEAHIWHEPSVARAEPVAPAAATASPAFASRSAFSWSNAPAMAAATGPAARNESHVDAALRGPTPENPFLSLKKRLRRAAFFDQRERAVAAGTAKPLSPMAGLPKAMASKANNFVRGGNVTARPAMVPA